MRLQAKVIGFLGSVKWSHDPAVALLSEPAASARVLGVLVDADEILVSLGTAPEENWNYFFVCLIVLRFTFWRS